MIDYTKVVPSLTKTRLHHGTVMVSPRHGFYYYLYGTKMYVSWYF